MAYQKENTISKVVVTLMITLVTLAGVTYFSFESYKDFTQALENLNSDSEDVILTESILSEIGVLETKGRTYLLTFSDVDLDIYIAGVRYTKVLIDSLYRHSYGLNYHSEVDSLRYFFKKRVESYNDLINVKSSIDQSDTWNSTKKIVTDAEQSVSRDSLVIPVEAVTTTMVSQIPQDDEDKDKGGWFKNVFGKKEKSKESSNSTSEIKQERVVTYDSSYVKKYDTLVSNVTEALEKTNQLQRKNREILNRNELSLVTYDQGLVEKLRSIIAKIQEIEAANEKVKKEETAELAKKSFQQVVLFALIAALISILLIYFVIRDILKGHRLQRELARAKLKAEKLAMVKEEFLANMSHEIRTPLNSILGFSKQMTGASMSADQEARLLNIRKSGEHLLMLVNDILDYSKIESGKLSLENIGFKLQSIVDETIGMLEHLAHAKGIKLESNLPSDISETILLGDPIRLKQILLNLIGNGIKFTDVGSVRLNVELESKSENGINILIQVIDTGKGIESSQLEKIFDKFDQEDKSISRNYGGTGLGLSICKKLVHLQGGRIYAESEWAKGSTFSVHLYFDTGEVDEYGVKMEEKNIELDFKGKSLLLIDDDDLNHKLLKPTMDRWAMDFISAYDAIEGLEFAQKRHFDFVMVDLQLPGKDGKFVIESLARDSQFRLKTKVILCTANALVDQFKPEFLQLVDATIFKPFTEQDIADALTGRLILMDSKRESMKKPHELYSLENFKVYAGGDSLILIQFLESFIESNSESLEQLGSLAKQKDYVNIGEVAHKMKNTFGQLEAVSVLRHLIALEQLVEKTLPEEEVKRHIKKTITHSKNVFAALHKEIDKLVTETQTSSP